MNRKAYIFIVLLIALLSILAGCKKTVEEKIGEKITEKVLESSSGADVDIDDEITTIKTDQGTTQMGTNIKWPKDKMGNLKELKTNITMLSEDTDNEITYIMFDSLKKEDAEKYIESLKNLGYKSVYEVTSADTTVYIGNNEKGFEVNFSYYDGGTGSLSLAKSEITDVDSFSVDWSSNNLFTGDPEPVEEIDMTDDVAWPKDFFAALPEIEGKITGLNSNGDSEKDIYLEYVEKDTAIEYINKIKEAGFVKEASDSTSSDYLEYEAYNSNEDYIIFVWHSDNTVSMSLIKMQ